MNTIELLAKIRCLPIDERLAAYQQVVENIAQANGATPDEIDGFLKAAYQMNKPKQAVSYGDVCGGMSEALLLVPGTETEETITAAIECVRREGVGRAAVIQRRFQFGYTRAVQVLEELHRRGFILKPAKDDCYEWPLV